jgi:hypothetical protein
MNKLPLCTITNVKFEPSCYDTVMKALVHQKEMALTLRKKGFTYREILAHVPVAKSSLSLWLKDTPLTSLEKAALKSRKDSNISRGRIKAAAASRQNRLVREKERLPEVVEMFNIYKSDPLFQLGIGLYWAEGAKSSGSTMFINSDAAMVEIILLWLERFTAYNRLDLRYRLYIHKPYAHEKCELWWGQKLKVPQSAFTITSYKPTSKGIKIRENYKGCLRVEVPRSSILLHTIKIWTDLMVEYHRKQ